MSKSPPTPPDYVGAAQAQGQSSQQLSAAQTAANRPNINTPFGSQAWTVSPYTDPTTGQVVGKWTQNTTLTPAMQAALTQQQGITKSQSDIASGLIGQERTQESKPIDFSKMMQIASTPGATTTNANPSASMYDKNASDAAFSMFKNYNQPLMDQAKDQLRTQLLNQGLKEGDQAYDTAMRNLENQQSMSTLQAENQSVLTGSQVGSQKQAADLAAQNQMFGQGLSGAQYQNTAAAQQMAMEMQKRGFTLNQINAILSGQQVGLPQTPSYVAAGSGQPVQALTAASEAGQAANAAFSAQQQGQAGTEAGIGSLALTAAVLY